MGVLVKSTAIVVVTRRRTMRASVESLSIDRTIVNCLLRSKRRFQWKKKRVLNWGTVGMVYNWENAMVSAQKSMFKVS